MRGATSTVVASAFLLAAGTSCGAGSSPDAGSPRRLVSLNPSHTETLVALGAGADIVGISNFCPEVTGAARLGDLYAPNLEAIAALRPTVVATVLTADHPTVRRLRDFGIRVLSLDPQSLDAVIETVRVLGREAGRETQADRLASELEARLDRARARAASRAARPRVYVELQPTPPWTVGPGSFLHEAVETAGGRNVFADLPRAYAQVSVEEIVARDPEVIVSLEAKAEDFLGRPGWQRVAAVRSKRIADDLGPEAIARGSPRLFDGLELLEARLFPPGEGR